MSFINDALVCGLKNASVFLDIKKAFNCVECYLLVKKLENCGIWGNLLQLLSSFLNKRTQCVKIGNFKSSDQNIKRGVAQGSVLGPLLFLSI